MADVILTFENDALPFTNNLPFILLVYGKLFQILEVNKGEIII